MSCEIQRTATFEGLDEFLSEDGENENSKKRFSACKIAYSPTGEIIVFAKSQKLLVCKSKWVSKDSSGSKIVYIPSCSDYSICPQGVVVTSVLCLPFEHEGKTKQSCSDWICIVVGFSSGHVKFFTEELHELYCTVLHKEPIKEIKCYYHPKVCQVVGDSNTLYILYKTVICVLNLIAVTDALRSRREKLAKGYSFPVNEHSLLHFEKYIFVGQELINDACYLGSSILSFSNAFEQFVLASLEGFNGRCRTSSSIFAVTSGKRPFVAFYADPDEKKYELDLGSIASAVGYVIKSGISGWFGLNQAEKPKDVILDPGKPLNCEFGLCDIWRQGHSIIVSPDCLFCAVSDSLGRVILVDNVTGVAQRMWKGYRDAQCGFIQVEESTRRTKRDKVTGSRPQPRLALFLIIYTPKRGLIEIFATQTGRRVGSFEVTESGRLIYIWYNPTRSDVPSNSSSVVTLNRVIFASEEGIEEFSIPFHCSLAEDNSKMDRDLHVLRKIKTILKTETNPEKEKFVEDIEKCAKELKTNEVKFQALELITVNNNTTVDALKAVLNVFTNDFQSKEPAPKKLVEFVKLIQNLVSLYEFVLNLEDSPPKYEAVVKEEGKATAADTSSLAEVLKLSEKELNMILTFMGQIKEIDCIKKPRVGFRESTSRKLGGFLSSFNFEGFVSGLENESECGEGEKVREGPGVLDLKSDSKKEYRWSVGELLFKGLLSSVTVLDDWKSHVKDCLLNPNDLVLCLMSYWCGKPFPDDFYSEVTSLVEILKAVCLLNDLNKVAVECNAESPWWSRLRSFIADNPFTIQGLFGALCCRSVTILVEQEREVSTKASSDKKDATSGPYPLAQEWETLSKDTCEWDIIISQLQDAALLNAILSLRFKDENKPGVLSMVPFDFEFQCLSSIQEKGTGRVSELVAKWLLQFGFDPEVLIDEKDVEFQTAESPKEETRPELVLELDKVSEGKSKAENLNLALEYLTLLKNRFPYSLTSSALLANVSWEYLAHWHKNITEIIYLEAGLRCLEAIPSSRIKYGVAYLSWCTYLEQKFDNLASMINRIGKVPRDKLCLQEIGLRNEQAPKFLKLIREYLKVMSITERITSETENDFGTDREGIWHYSTSRKGGRSLVSIALSQPNIQSSSFELSLSAVILIISGLNVKAPKMFSTLFGRVERSSFSMFHSSQPNASQSNLMESRKLFLRKAIAGAVQTIELIECLPAGSLEEDSETLPSARFNVDEYTKWISLCSELSQAWSIGQNFIRVHQICELYSSGYDHLAEEVIPSIYPDSDLASQLLVLAGKRLKYVFQDSRFNDLKSTYYSSNIYNWTQSLDLENFTYQSKSFADTEVMLNHIISWFPEDDSEKKLAMELLDLLITLEDERMTLE